MLNLKPNFLKIYLTNPYDFMLEILLRTSLFFWYMKILLRSFSFWDIENVKPKFQPRYAYKLYAYKKRVYEMRKKVLIIAKINFSDIFTKFIYKFAPICKNNFRKASFQFAKLNSAKLPENEII